MGKKGQLPVLWLRHGGLWAAEPPRGRRRPVTQLTVEPDRLWQACRDVWFTSRCARGEEESRLGDALQLTSPARRPKPQVPRDILENEALNASVAVLPSNYNFEVRRQELEWWTQQRR